ncbi:uncharacterized protein LOC129224325 [Uloborus diversus]|uniref:uncharacterized protein LOC129224325 n=1 Tax=Uloborus diversus TaxID=327109 RepID=UPI002409AA49|nr:uncharacterized protein LOC129224325 [Uloborus diversus]
MNCDVPLHASEKIKQEKTLDAYKKSFPKAGNFVNHKMSLGTSEKIKQKTPDAFKKGFPKPQSNFVNHDRPLRTSEKIKRISPESFKRSYPKPESDFVKSCQPVKKIFKNNTFENSSSDSKQSALVSKKIKVKNKDERKSCSISSDSGILPKDNEASTAQLSEEDTDNDFECFVKKHKPRHSSQTKKSQKKNKKSQLSSDEEDETEKTEKCKKKKLHKSKSSKDEKTIKTIDKQESRKTRSNSYRILEPKESSSDEQIDDKASKVKWKKRKTQELSQSITVTEKVKHREKSTRSKLKYVIESSESESVDMYSNNVCSDTSDDCAESTPKLLPEINSEKNTNESAEFNKEAVSRDVCKEICASDLIHEKDIIREGSVNKRSNLKTSVHSENFLSLSVPTGKELGDNELVSEKNIIPKRNVNQESNQKTFVNSENGLSLSVHNGKELSTSNDLVNEKNISLQVSENKKSNLKASTYSENVLTLSSRCSVLIEQNNDIDKKAKISSSKDCKNATKNDINTLPVVTNEIIIDLSDEEKCACPIQSDSVHNIESSQCLLESNKQLPNLNPCAQVQAEDAGKELASLDFTNCAESKRTNENEDSDVEIVEIDAPKPTFSKVNHNGDLATKSSSISQEKTLDTDASVVKQLNENMSLKVSAEQVNTECGTRVSFNEPKTAPLEEKKLQVIGAKLPGEGTSFSVTVDSNDDITILETSSAERKENLFKGSDYAKSKPLEYGENKSITENCITLSDEEDCEDLEKMGSQELVKPCSESIDKVLNKEVNILEKTITNGTELNSLPRTISSDTTGIMPSKSENVPISDEEDCIILLESTSCVAESLKEKEVSLKIDNSCFVSQVKTPSTEQNNEVKLCNFDCSSENNVCNSVAKNVTSLNQTFQIQSSEKSLNKETLDLENDCIILDDAPVQLCSEEKIKCNSLLKEDMSHRLVDNIKSSNSIVVSQSAKALSSDRFSNSNLNESSLESGAKLSDTTLCSDRSIHSFNNTNTVGGASSNIVGQNANMSLINDRVKSESSFSSHHNAYCKQNFSPIGITEQKIQRNLGNQESLTVERSTLSFEKSSEPSSNTKIPFVNEMAQCTNRHVDPQNRLGISRNASSDIDIKPCVYPSNILPESDRPNNFMNCDLNSENSSKEFRKKLQCNYTPHSDPFHDDISILLGDKDLPSSNNLNKIILDSLNNLKAPEKKSFFQLNSLNELDALAESSIYELSCTENKSILPLLNLYKNEIGYYKKLQQTVKNVDSGIRTALELQAERLKHLAFSIQNIVQNDPCFSNPVGEKCYLPIQQKQIEEKSLQDKEPYFSAEEFKKSHSSKNILCDVSSSTSSAQGNDPCFSNAFFEKCYPPVEQKQIKQENLQDEVPYLSTEDLKKNHSSKNNLCDSSSSTVLGNDPCFSNSFFEKCYPPMEQKQIKQESLEDELPYSSTVDLRTSHTSKNNINEVSSSTSSALGNEPCFSNSFFEKCYPPMEQKQIKQESLQDEVSYPSAEDLRTCHTSKSNLNDVSMCSTLSASGNWSVKDDRIPVSNFSNESAVNLDNLPQLSLESLHENSSNCIDSFEPRPIKSEPIDETGEDQYFEEEIKYSKSSAFHASQPEVIQELRNSKCCLCNKPAVGACYFCCSVFYCSVECSESVIGRYHREVCSKEYSEK